MSFHLLGIDAGTTSMKAVLFDERGKEVASALEEYRLITPRPDIVELDARTYWAACKACLNRIMESAGVPRDSVKALAISSQGESAVPIGRDGEPLRNTIIWLDNRAAAEAAKVKEEFGAERVYHTSGSHEVVPCWGGVKMFWIKENEPQIFDQADKLLLVEDYLIYKLTGEFVGETALYCSTLLMDINTGKWWDEFLDFTGIPKEKLVRLAAPGEIVGKLTLEAAQATGLSTETVVVTGGMDQACGSVGSGNIRPGIVTETTGASLNICATTDKPVFDPKFRMPCQIHCTPGDYIVLPWCQTAGMALKWFRDQFCVEEKWQAEEQGLDAYDLMTALAAEVPAGSHGLIMLPHLAGSMCPESNPRARAVFFGAGLESTKGHFIRAVMEAIAYMLKDNLDAMAELGIEPETIISLGGAAKSSLWAQIKADVVNKPVEVLDNPEAACLGAAIVAGKAVGLFSSIEDACKEMISVQKVYYPNPENVKIQQENYEKYKQLYKHLEPLF